MKTLLIISHPDYQQSMGQQFLKESIKDESSITVHHLDSVYPNGNFSVGEEIKLLKKHDRIIFQFPLYWYSSPSLLKEWQDQVLSNINDKSLKNKEFGIVLSVGTSDKEYRPGGKIELTMEQILAPFQALAKYFEIQYLPHFPINQFAYMTEEKKAKLLIDYQYYLTGPSDTSLAARTSWFLAKLSESKHSMSNDIVLLKETLLENQEILEELKDTLNEMGAEGAM